MSASEGKNLIDQVKAIGTPIMILSGGDPLNRGDLEELIRHGKSEGLRMGTIPAATPNLTRERLAALKEAGVDQIAFSLDGATAAARDAFRRTPGAFDTVLRAARWARELGIPFQINSCFGAWNRHEFDGLAELVSGLDVAFWEVFFLIPVGRGVKLGGLAFVDHLGDICPSGFLPVRRGNVRTDGLAETYRYDALFRGLRDHARLKGGCGACEYREVCGGSRARAWATTGDAWAEDPACIYEPGRAPA